MLLAGADSTPSVGPATGAISLKSTDSLSNLSVSGIFSADKILPARTSTFLNSSYEIMEQVYGILGFFKDFNIKNVERHDEQKTNNTEDRNSENKGDFVYKETDQYR